MKAVLNKVRQRIRLKLSTLQYIPKQQSTGNTLLGYKLVKKSASDPKNKIFNSFKCFLTSL